MLNESIQYKKLTDIEDRKLNQMLHNSKIDLNITHDKEKLDFDNLKLSSGLGVITPICDEKMKVNIIKIFDNDSPSKKFQSISASYDNN